MVSFKELPDFHQVASLCQDVYGHTHDGEREHDDLWKCRSHPFPIADLATSDPNYNTGSFYRAHNHARWSSRNQPLAAVFLRDSDKGLSVRLA